MLLHHSYHEDMFWTNKHHRIVEYLPPKRSRPCRLQPFFCFFLQCVILLKPLAGVVPKSCRTKKVIRNFSDFQTRLVCFFDPFWSALTRRPPRQILSNCLNQTCHSSRREKTNPLEVKSVGALEAILPWRWKEEGGFFRRRVQVYRKTSFFLLISILFVRSMSQDLVSWKSMLWRRYFRPSE